MARSIWWIFGEGDGMFYTILCFIVYGFYFVLYWALVGVFLVFLCFSCPYFCIFRACHFMFPGGNESSLRQTNSTGRPDTFNGCQKCCHGNVCCKMAAYEAETHVLKDSGIDTGHSSSSQTLNEDSSKVPPKTYLARSTSYL